MHSPKNAPKQGPKQEPKTIAAFIDGYNLYCGCRALLSGRAGCYEKFLQTMWYCPKEIVRVCGGFAGDDEILANFYTSEPQQNSGQYLIAHYNRYTAALKARGVRVVTGKFQMSAKTELAAAGARFIDAAVKELGVVLRGAGRPWNEVEREKVRRFFAELTIPPIQREKQTDVNLAIDIARHFYQDTGVDTVVLVSGDADFDPLIRKAICEAGGRARLLVLLPPREKRELRKKAIDGVVRKAVKQAKKDGNVAAAEFFADNFRVEYINAEHLEKCNLPGAAERLLADDKDKKKWKGCDCGKGECREGNL